MSSRLFSVVFDAVDFVAMGRFWSAALGWRLDEESLQSDEAVVRGGDASAPDLLFLPVPGAKRGKNRIHLDLFSDAGVGQSGTVSRLADLGAAPIDIGQGQVPWVVMADPEGNEFCVSEHEARHGTGVAAICLDAADAAQQRRFWSAATGWHVDAEGPWGVGLRSPTGADPALILGPPVAPKHGKNRVHLDVAPSVGDDQEAEARRLIARGARRVDVGQGDVSWIVLADPEDNEFCMLTPR